MNAPRKYRDERDLEAMRNLLMDGRKADNGTYYIHTGDLYWWLYYPPLEGDLWDHIYLWDDPQKPGCLSAWALLSPDWVGMDVYIQPELRGDDIAMGMYRWAEEQAEKLARERGKPTIHTLWVDHDDDVLNKYFLERGFKRGKGYVQLRLSLDGELPLTLTPAGFSIRSSQGEQEAVARAKAQYAAFSSPASLERYLERFSRFVRSPAYNPDHDIVAAAPDGQVGAFCIVWTDATNQVGLFEPVGTHPDFQRKGLGKAVMQEGLHRLKLRGMRSAIVTANDDNLAAIRLYESVGFQVIRNLGTYEKDV